MRPYAIFALAGLLLLAGAILYNNPAVPRAQGQAVLTSSVDPCLTTTPKSSVAVNISTATTTQLVAPSGTTAVYVCGYSGTVNSVVTTATTLQFITGSGATCGTNTVTNTGLFNGGNVTAGVAVWMTFADPGTTFKSAAGSGVCLVSAGTTVQIQGVLTFIQQ